MALPGAVWGTDLFTTQMKIQRKIMLTKVNRISQVVSPLVRSKVPLDVQDLITTYPTNILKEAQYSKVKFDC